MKVKELRSKNAGELQKLLLELRREQFNLRMQKGTGQLGKPSEVSRVRRDIAQIKTIMAEMAASTNQ